MATRTSRPSSPSPAHASAPLRLERCRTAPLLVYGLVLVAVMGGAPAAALWGQAPEAARAIVAWCGVTSLMWAAVVMVERRRWCVTTVEVSGELLEVRRPQRVPERVALREIRRMRWSAAGLTVWTAGGRALTVGRLRHPDVARLAARLETASAVPIEGLETIDD
jgi:hypothetical protein